MLKAFPEIGSTLLVAVSIQQVQSQAHFFEKYLNHQLLIGRLKKVSLKLQQHRRASFAPYADLVGRRFQIITAWKTLLPPLADSVEKLQIAI